MAQFVGTDRGLKRLGLLTAGGADLDSVIDRAGVDPRAPELKASTTLRDALAVMLEREVQQAPVVDDNDGRYLGVLTLVQISKMLGSQT